MFTLPRYAFPLTKQHTLPLWANLRLFTCRDWVWHDKCLSCPQMSCSTRCMESWRLDKTFGTRNAGLYLPSHGMPSHLRYSIPYPLWENLSFGFTCRDWVSWQVWWTRYILFFQPPKHNCKFFWIHFGLCEFLGWSMLVEQDLSLTGFAVFHFHICHIGSHEIPVEKREGGPSLYHLRLCSDMARVTVIAVIRDVRVL